MKRKDLLRLAQRWHRHPSNSGLAVSTSWDEVRFVLWLLALLDSSRLGSWWALSLLLHCFFEPDKSLPLSLSPSPCCLKQVKIGKAAKECPRDVVRFCKRHILRVYPSFFRVDSSNFDPQKAWGVGVQCVALNLQTKRSFMSLHRVRRPPFVCVCARSVSVFVCGHVCLSVVLLALPSQSSWVR